MFSFQNINPEGKLCNSVPSGTSMKFEQDFFLWSCQYNISVSVFICCYCILMLVYLCIEIDIITKELSLGLILINKNTTYS